MSSSHSPLLGAHQSIAGGIHRAVERAESIGATALQVFTKNSNRWQGPPVTDEDASSYKTALSKSRIVAVASHDSYLINLCAVDPDVLRKSREALVDEVRRCEKLGIPLLNFHPGAHMGAGEKSGIELIVESLNMVHRETAASSVLSVVETTAGQGSVLGYTFEQIAAIVEGVENPERMGVCIDTCHIFAAGYDIRKKKAYQSTMGAFDDVVGLDRLVMMHLNDAKNPLGSRRDRHDHIGKGEIGVGGFRHIMNDERLSGVPKILETPKGDDLAEDRMNMKVLKGLLRRKGTAGTGRRRSGA